MIADVLLPAALAFIMFSIGIALKPGDFRQVFAQPAGLAIGMAGQLLLLPLGALAVATLAGLPVMLTVGLLILAACPGGASSAFLTHLARGNTALSLMLTVISSLAALLTFPLLVKLVFVNLGGDGFADGVRQIGDLPAGRLIGSVLVVTTLPIVAGMWLRRVAEGFVLRREALVGRMATAFFIAIVFGTFFSHQQIILANLASVGPVTLLLNLLVMAATYGLTLLCTACPRDAVAVAMESGLQNAGLGIYVSLVLLRQPEFAVPCVVYALTMNIGALALVFFSRRSQARRALAAG